MFNTVAPEKVGISSKSVCKFVKALEKRGIPMHQIILAHGYDIFGEFYWKPFDKDFCHRMYSQTKSYVAVAIGLLVEDGKLNLTDKIADIFPEKINSELKGFLPDLTVEHMLKMETCGCVGVPFWFYDPDPDRTHMYFEKNMGEFPSNMRWEYDSSGSQILSNVVEKLSGKTLFDFLNERIFSHLDAFKTAQILKTKNGDSWGDSALVCTPRDMLVFARFVMNKGVWNGKRLMNAEYLEKATSKLADNCVGISSAGFDIYFTQGYGYQIWRIPGGFAFNGMGSQLTLCLPEKDLIFVCTGDTQGLVGGSELVASLFYSYIVDNLEDGELPSDDKAYAELLEYADTLKLYAMTGEAFSPYQSELEGKVWKCRENPLGWSEFSFNFNSDDTAVLNWKNAQGEKHLTFGLCKNVFGKFPHLGYQNIYGGVETNEGFMYDGAYSGAWRE